VKRLRLAYLAARLNPGGAERQMLSLAERLPKDRFAVDFLTLLGAGLYDDRARASGARVHHLGRLVPPEASISVKAVNRATKTWAYLSTVSRRRYDIVDAWLYPTDVLAALARPLTRTPVVMAGQRNIDPQDQFGAFERIVSSTVRRMIDVVVANSAAAADHAAANGVDPTRIRIIRNGVLIPDRQPAAERAARRAELGAGPDDVFIGCVANYRYVKRLDVLVEAVAPLIREGLPIRLELIGDGPMRAELERWVRDAGIETHTCLHGPLPSPEPYYGAFDITVQSSEREGLPNVLLEAGAAGRAMVATAAGGSSEIVIDGQTGLLVPIGDPAALGAAVRRLVLDPELRDRLGEAARAHVERMFGMDRFVQEFATLYESLMERNRAGR
jgi:glycosyltransferase involved in cell wall biosynthesis